MTTLSDRPNTALVVIDVQKGVVAGAHGRDDGRQQHRRPRRQGPAPRRSP